MPLVQLKAMQYQSGLKRDRKGCTTKLYAYKDRSFSLEHQEIQFIVLSDRA